MEKSLGESGEGWDRSQKVSGGLGQGLGVLDSCSYNNQVYFVILKNKHLFYSVFYSNMHTFLGKYLLDDFLKKQTPKQF